MTARTPITTVPGHDSSITSRGRNVVAVLTYADGYAAGLAAAPELPGVDGGCYLGGYLGLMTLTITEAADDPDDDLEPVESPVAVTEPTYVDHAAAAIGRLAEQFKAKDSDA